MIASAPLLRLIAGLRQENREISARVKRLEDIVSGMVFQEAGSGYHHNQIGMKNELECIKSNIVAEPTFRESLVR